MNIRYRSVHCLSAVVHSFGTRIVVLNYWKPLRTQGTDSTHKVQRDTSFRERAEEFDRQLLQFLEREIETTLTFARLAETEVGRGNREGAAAAVAKAKQGHDETLRWMNEARKRKLSIEHLEAHLEELLEALQSLRTRIDLEE